MKRWTWPGRRLVLKARFAVDGAREAARAAIHARRPTLPLEQVQRRLELLLAAMYGRPIAITPVEATNANWIERVGDFLSRDPRTRESTPGVDGAGIQLPVTLTARDGDAAAIARYRLLAIEQAERLTRGTANHAPLRDPLRSSEIDLTSNRSPVVRSTMPPAITVCAPLARSAASSIAGMVRRSR